MTNAKVLEVGCSVCMSAMFEDEQGNFCSNPQCPSNSGKTSMRAFEVQRQIALPLSAVGAPRDILRLFEQSHQISERPAELAHHHVSSEEFEDEERTTAHEIPNPGLLIRTTDDEPDDAFYTAPTLRPKSDAEESSAEREDDGPSSSPEIETGEEVMLSLAELGLPDSDGDEAGTVFESVPPDESLPPTVRPSFHHSGVCSKSPAPENAAESGVSRPASYQRTSSGTIPEVPKQPPLPRGMQPVSLVPSAKRRGT